MLSHAMTEGQSRPPLGGLALGLAVGAIFLRPLFQRSYGSLFLGLLCGTTTARSERLSFAASLALIGFTVCAAVLCNCFDWSGAITASY